MGAMREGGAIHTEGEWFAGGGSWVATQSPILCEVIDEIIGSNDVGYYGGYLIGESISSCNIPIISAAPDMFKALLAVKQKLHFLGMPGEKVCKVTGKSDWSDEIKLIEAALAKAVTRVPVPAKVASVPASTDVGEGWRVIGDDEVFIAGDEFDNNHHLAIPMWLDVEVCLGQRKGDSELSKLRCRRKVEPITQSITIDSAVFSVGAGGAGGLVEPVDEDSVGYRIVGQDEMLIAGDEYWNKIGDFWDPVYSEVGKQKQISSLSKHRVRRRIVNDGELVDAEFKVLEQPKPPLGLMPRQMWLENRRDDIYDAIARYRTAGKDVSRDWLNELLDLDNEMRPF